MQFVILVIYNSEFSHPVGDPGKANGVSGERRSKDTGEIFRLRKMQRCGFRFDDVGADDHCQVQMVYTSALIPIPPPPLKIKSLPQRGRLFADHRTTRKTNILFCTEN